MAYTRVEATVSAMNDLRNLLGPDLGRTDPEDRTDRIRWVRLCACGHQEGAHAVGIGGTYAVPEPADRVISSRPTRIIQVATGCVGSMPGQTFERFTDTVEADGEVTVITRRHNPTCPCTAFHAVADVDRPHRFFNQRRPAVANRGDVGRHPLTVGMRAYRVRIGRLKRAQVSELGEQWADEEFDKRFRWTGRVCSQCDATDDVWPSYVDADGTSEMRCPQHRP